MIALCHRCHSSNVECVVDFEISQEPNCLECYSKRDKSLIAKYQSLLNRLPPREDIHVDGIIQKLKGASED